MTPKITKLIAHADTLEHGQRGRYVRGCRCTPCTVANRLYAAARYHAQKAGDWNGIVPANKARRHLRRLSHLGVGRRAISAATDIAESILCEIRAGTRKRIRARTERRILRVTEAQASDHALAPAVRTWQLIDELLEEGYTEKFLAQRLGYANPTLQLARGRVTVRNAARIERLHKELTT